MEGKPSLSELSTMTLDYFFPQIQLSEGQIINCIIYDTCGAGKLNRINESYYEKADAILLVYDITKRFSFEKIKNYYIGKIKELCKKDIVVSLVGNKLDRESERKISYKEAKELAMKEKFLFNEVSCLKNLNVYETFETIVTETFNKTSFKKKRITEIQEKLNKYFNT